MGKMTWKTGLKGLVFLYLGIQVLRVVTQRTGLPPV